MGRWKNRRLDPALDNPFAAARLCETTELITAGQIVYISGRAGAVSTVSLARANARATSMGTLLIAKHTTPLGGQGIFQPWTLLAADTSSNVAGAQLFLSGAVAGLSVAAHDAGTIVRRQVGTTIDSAVAGQVEFNFNTTGEEIGGTGVGLVSSITTMPIAAGPATNALVFRDAQTYVDSWFVTGTGGTTESLVVDTASGTVSTLVTGTVSTGDIVRAPDIIAAEQDIAAGASVTATLSGTTITGTLYVLTTLAV